MESRRSCKVSVSCAETAREKVCTRLCTGECARQSVHETVHERVCTRLCTRKCDYQRAVRALSAHRRASRLLVLRWSEYVAALAPCFPDVQSFRFLTLNKRLLLCVPERGSETRVCLTERS
ncbi:hypothetical protein NDU88_007394 [Pleurodeles waltl]|uniref:Uncharacterized protein n=1 Tax=Pleurodeles waltl TaxID=8319 RepID=A0AAV7WGV0_PLEWA|nr:hypothetical protein NDU88_007394 [Pleurodeles waltl]